MKLALIGFGQAGGRIVERFVEYDRRTGGGFVAGAVAVNSAQTDLAGLEAIPVERRVLVGAARVRGHGVGADNDLGAQVTSEDLDEILGAIDRIPGHDVDAFLVVAGMGGGTGSGGAPVLAQHLQRIEAAPVYGLGVLPATDEGGIYTLNAARSFQTFVREVDTLFVFDNDAWRLSGESIASGFDRINEEIVRRFATLFGAGEIQDGDAVPESVVDASEIINTLSASGGVSTVGYAAEPVSSGGFLSGGGSGGILSRLLGRGRSEDSVSATNRVTSLVRKATLGRLTLPCGVSSAERALVVASGPPAYLDRKGLEHGRSWLEEVTGSLEVRGGDVPTPGRAEVSITVVLSGVSDVPRIERLQHLAVETQDAIAEDRADRADRFESLVHDGADELSPLF